MLQFNLQKKLHSTEGEMQLHINCEIKVGEFVSLYGNSGAGKTSILRMLAGFMKPEKGFVKLNEDDWFDEEKKIDVVPQQRKIGFVFQDYALFPNMTVRENIAFPLAKNDTINIVDELLQLTGLQNFSNRKIQTLSGGQQQRVALARAIVRKPKLLLLDEPLSAIDDAMRVQLQETLLQVHKKYGLTTILVSHNINEVVKLSDKILHIKEGQLEQFNSAGSFLYGIGQLTGFVGNIISINQNEICLFVHNSVVSIVAYNQTVEDLKKGDLIEIISQEKTNVIRKLKP